MTTTETDPTDDNAFAQFLTVDILNEQLAVIDQYLQTINPNLPTQATRRNKLVEEKGQILRIIETMQVVVDRGDSGSSGSASRSLSPQFSPQVGTSYAPSVLSATGSSTPDTNSFPYKDTWNFTNEDTMAQSEQDRAEQELADWEYAQLIASQLADDDDQERQRQRQAQIAADEELARQIADRPSPVSAREPLQTDLNYMRLHQDESTSPAWQSITGNQIVSTPVESPLRTRQERTPEVTRCDNCSEILSPGMDDFCWRCEEQSAFSPSSSLPSQSTQPPHPIKSETLPGAWVQGPSTTTYNINNPFMGLPQRSQSVPQPQVSISSYVPFTQNANQFQWPQVQNQASFIGQGTSSSPITLDSPQATRQFMWPPQRNPLSPSVPGTVPNGNLLNNGWPFPGQQFPRPAQNIDPASYLPNLPVFDYNVPAPSTEEIKDLLSNIRPDEEIKIEDKDAIIPGLAKNMRLMKHQQMGVAWMQKMEDGKNKGGILADDMGLGKTIQSIALLVTRPSEDKRCKTTLICTPVALLRQWYNEIRTKTSPSLSVYIHHTSARGKKLRTSKELLQFDVVLTTYNTLAHEWKVFDKWNSADPEARPVDPPRCLFLDTEWYRVILDEAQVIKNRFTQTAKAAHSLKSMFRWSLSGTPMQNGIEEMYSQIAFLRIRPYSQWKSFHGTFVVGLKKASKQSASMRKFQALLKAILLRRTKMSKIDGVEIVKGLPSKSIEMVHAVFDEEQQEFYQALETGMITQLRKYQAAGTLGRNFSNALVMLLRLRQACLHPRLIKEIKKAGSTELTMDQQIVLAREFAEQTVSRIKTITNFECPICFETVLNPTLILPCGHHYCTECLSSLFDQETENALADGEDTRDKGKCPECRGDMNAKRTVSLEAFKTAHCDVDMEDETGESEAEEDWSLEDDRKRKGKGKESAHKVKSYKRSKAKFEEDEEWTSSAKIDKLCEILDGIRAKDPSEKVIVFSQFTGYLDIIGPALYKKMYNYGRYDGGMSAREREEELEVFKTDPARTIFLVSLRAGAYGLNLTCASQCIILDPFWNPFVEDQAIDRIHRIGQVRPVIVHRIVIEGTVEDRILALQEKKRDIIEGALAEDASKAIARLSAKDLLFLFGING